MSDTKKYTVRPVNKEDEPALKAIWKTVFGDEEKDIDAFFSHYFTPGLTAAVYDRHVPVSAGYALPVGSLVTPGGEYRSCAMVYAIATLPEFRGHGFGEDVTEAAAGFAEAAGYGAVVLCPASDSLFDYYLSRTRFRIAFDTYEAFLSGTELSSAESSYQCQPVSPQDYRQLRINLLSGYAYIDMDERALSFQQHLCASLGGGLLEITDQGRQIGCAVAERQGDGSVWIKELLVTDGCSAAAAAATIAEILPAEEYLIRSPSPYDIKNMVRRRFGLALPSQASSGFPPVDTSAWFGLAFD